MAEFKSWQSYRIFENSVKKKNRYFRDPDTEIFLKTVLETCKGLERKIPKGSILWRSQLGHGLEPIYVENEHVDDIPAPLSADRMKPFSYKAPEGRANPTGISYLYLANNKETAMSEVRPWVGSHISVGQFKIKRDLIIIDFSRNRETNSFFCVDEDFNHIEPSPEERERDVWSDIGRAFAKPININDQKTEYIPTQIIAELFKSNNYDGIAYKSALCKGYNVVMFDLDIAELINCFLYKVEKIDCTFKEDGRPYSIKKKDNKSKRSKNPETQ